MVMYRFMGSIWNLENYFLKGVLKMGFEGIVLIILTAVLVYGLISAVTGKY